MKIAFDVDVIKHLTITNMVRQVSEWGYKFIEQSPHPRINPFYKYPKVGRDTMKKLLPIIECEGIRIEIQSHPWDFIITISLFGYPE